MEITNNVSNVQQKTTTTNDTKIDSKEKQTNQSTASNPNEKAKNDAAVYESGSKEKANNYPIDRKKIDAMIKESENQVDSLRKLLEKLLQRQANNNALISGKNAAVEYDDLLNKVYNGENVNVEVDEATRLQAKEDISEDGYYGVKKTSERILNFAKAISGGDPSKISMLRDAAQKGFDAVEEMWGGKGKLPKISYDTYDAVMKGFDEWEESSKAPQTQIIQ